MNKNFYNTNFSGVDWYMLMGPEVRDAGHREHPTVGSRKDEVRTARWFNAR